MVTSSPTRALFGLILRLVASKSRAGTVSVPVMAKADEEKLVITEV